ncbi:MAG: hypothetical protein A2X42_06015 [Candidatus Margulisbacteria bacterium GWF2_38_17]|nr:MAG: hypothetical protein A2X42_06015 [Candidatus Margulisbacteria bacterium GWF2_38_17]
MKGTVLGLLKIFYSLLMVFSLLLAGCAQEFRDATVTPKKIEINSATGTFDRVFLAWNYPSGYPTINIGVYQLYRDTADVVALVSTNFLVELSSTANTYEDTAVSENTLYYYKLLYKDFFEAGIIDVSAPKMVQTCLRASVNVTIDFLNPSSPTLAISAQNYYPQLDFQLYRITGNFVQVPTSAPVAFSGLLSGGSIIKFRDPIATQNPNQIYSYQLRASSSALNAVITSNVLQKQLITP